jgi:hypothetical protein
MVDMYQSGGHDMESSGQAFLRTPEANEGRGCHGDHEGKQGDQVGCYPCNIDNEPIANKCQRRGYKGGPPFIIWIFCRPDALNLSMRFYEKRYALFRHGWFSTLSKGSAVDDLRGNGLFY